MLMPLSAKRIDSPRSGDLHLYQWIDRCETVKSFILQLQIDRFFLAFFILRSQGENGAEKTGLATNDIRLNNGSVVRSEGFNLKVAKNACLFFYRCGEHRGH